MFDLKMIEYIVCLLNCSNESPKTIILKNNKHETRATK